MLAGANENLLINGDFLPSLWRDSADTVECEPWRQTFAAERWKVRLKSPDGSAPFQLLSHDTPPESLASCSLEIRGRSGVTQPTYIGQRVEAAEAVRYRRRLLFSAWVRVVGSQSPVCDLGLLLSSARDRDCFGNAFNDRSTVEHTDQFLRIPTGRWIHLECVVDARSFGSHGLSVELELPAELLADSGCAVRIAAVRLADVSVAAGMVTRSASVEGLLARRFFQRHDSSILNSLGRPIVVNPHELHFQMTFPEMRTYPACILPDDEEGLRVFDIEGFPQSGFRYDVTYRSRGSVILRATKENHSVRDGFLSFVGSSASILLDSEL